jgi:hypothetical protein
MKKGIGPLNQDVAKPTLCTREVTSIQEFNGWYYCMVVFDLQYSLERKSQIYSGPLFNEFCNMQINSLLLRKTLTQRSDNFLQQVD